MNDSTVWAEKILREMAADIRKEVDAEILIDIYATQGYYVYKHIKHEMMEDITEWCQENCTDYVIHHVHVGFKNEKDYNWFLLRWT